jgi:hypothetical protein
MGTKFENLPAFKTSIAQRVELSAAYSIHSNTRNLEKHYNNVWHTVISELVKPHSDAYQCSSEPALWLSKSTVNIALLKELKDAKEFHQSQTQLEEHGQKHMWESLIQSDNKAIQKLEMEIADQAKHDEERGKSHRDFCVFVITLPADQQFADRGNISIGMNSVHGRGLDTYPDFVISRIMAYRPDIHFPITVDDVFELSRLRISGRSSPQSKERLSDYCRFLNWQMNLRGQMSTMFTYTCLIGELKRPPSREVPGWGTPDFNAVFDEFYASWRSMASVSLSEAVDDLVYYSAVHFHQNPDAPYVIIIPAVGPYWMYAKIEKGDVPTIQDYMATDLDSLYTDRDPEAIIANQRGKILKKLQPPRGGMLLLGTDESDKMLTKVRDEVFRLEETFPVPDIPQKKMRLPVSTRKAFLEPDWELID